MMGLKPMVIFVWDGQGENPDHSLPPGLSAPVDPGFGVPAPGGRPPQAGQLPSGPGGRPPHASQLPGYPPIPVLPPTTKPSPGQPPAVAAPLPALPQGSFVVVWAPGQGYVAVPIGPHPDQGLPGGQPPHASGQPVPPGAAPTPTPQGRR